MSSMARSTCSDRPRSAKVARGGSAADGLGNRGGGRSFGRRVVGRVRRGGRGFGQIGSNRSGSRGLCREGRTGGVRRLSVRNGRGIGGAGGKVKFRWGIGVRGTTRRLSSGSGVHRRERPSFRRVGPFRVAPDSHAQPANLVSHRGQYGVIACRHRANKVDCRIKLAQDSVRQPDHLADRAQRAKSAVLCHAHPVLSPNMPSAALMANVLGMVQRYPIPHRTAHQVVQRCQREAATGDDQRIVLCV